MDPLEIWSKSPNLEHQILLFVLFPQELGVWSIPKYTIIEIKSIDLERKKEAYISNTNYEHKFEQSMEGTF